MSKIPLSRQIEAGRLLVSDGDIRDEDAVSALWQTLAWMERNADALRAGADLMRHDAVRALKDAFPDARLVGVSEPGLTADAED